MPTRNPPRLLLVSGIFFPDVGGPAVHVRRIATHMASQRWEVTVLAFGEDIRDEQPYKVQRISRRQGKLFSWLKYGYAVLRESRRTDVIYAFDLTTAGLPAAVSSTFFSKPFLLRIGGDPIWERVVEHGQRFLPMRNYYAQELYMIDRPLLYRIIRFVVRRADHIITYCSFLEEIYCTYYGVRKSQLTIIPNPLPQQQESPREKDTVTFIFAGRFVLYKNLKRLIQVFTKLHHSYPKARLLLIGDGPEEESLRDLAKPVEAVVEILPKVPQEKLFALIRGSSVALAPALSEFNPNFILESLALGKPAIISKDHGLSVTLPDELLFDPLDDDSLYQAMERLMHEEAYNDAQKFITSHPVISNWDTVTAQHESLVTKYANP